MGYLSVVRLKIWVSQMKSVGTQTKHGERFAVVVSLYLPQVRVALIGTAKAVPEDYIRIDCGEFLVRTPIA